MKPKNAFNLQCFFRKQSAALNGQSIFFCQHLVLEEYTFAENIMLVQDFGKNFLEISNSMKKYSNGGKGKSSCHISGL